MNLEMINMNDPLEITSSINFINNLQLSDDYYKYANIWSKFPIYDDKEKIKIFFELLNENQVILINSGTGSGKTVIIPKFIFKYMIVNKIEGIIAITNPKILTTMYNAEYGAKTLDIILGEEVGYKFNGALSNSHSNKTKLLYVTDGLILSEILNKDPLLKKYNCIIIDEAHERHVQIDLLLFFLKEILKKRSDFKIIIMSATIDGDIFKSYFSNDNIKYGEITFSGQANYPIDEIWIDAKINKYNYVEKSIEIINEIKNQGDTIVFVATEKDTLKGCDLVNKKYLHNDVKQKNYCASVYSKMKQNDKDLAIDQNKYKKLGFDNKIIFATNVAESSVTINGLLYVIDTGFELIKSYNPKKYMDIIDKNYTSQAQIKQRIGRVGRTQKGTAYHLYTKNQFDNFNKYPEPNIKITNMIMFMCLFFKYSKNLTNLLILINKLIDPLTFDQIIGSIYKLHFYNIIKIVHNIDNEIKQNSLEFTKIDYKNINSIDALCKFNGTLKTIGYLLIKLKLSSIENTLAVIYSKYFNCQKEMIIIISILEACGNKISDLFIFGDDIDKNIINFFKKSLNKNSDHLTLFNIYINNYKNQNYKYLNLKIWDKIDKDISNLMEKMEKIKKNNNQIDENNEQDNLENLSDNLYDNINYVLLKSNYFNIIKKINKKEYSSINYYENSKAEILFLKFITNHDNYDIGISSSLTNIFGKKMWQCITLFDKKIINKFKKKDDIYSCLI